MGDTFQPPFNRRLAIAIGIDQYHNGIAQLHTAANDAKVLARILRTDYDYQVWEFIDTDATQDQLKTLFKSTLPKELSPTDQDCLLIYFAGHGIARNNDKDGPVGYLIPQDARPEDESTFLPMQVVIQALDALECRHMLLIADCCFAGAFRWASSRDIVIAPGTVHKQRYDRFVNSAAWQVLTSAAYDQKAIDLVRDNRSVVNAEGFHSPFAEALLAALGGAGDLNGDQLVTATELYLYLRDCVEKGSDNEQTPGIWPLPKHEYGEYLFLSKAFDRATLEEAPPLDEANNPYRGLNAYEARHTHLFFGRDALIKTLYQDHVAHHPLTVVLGASGTGKSSLVKAGLVPYLQNHEALIKRKAFKKLENRAQEDWQILPALRPGNEPLRSLAEAIMPICTETPSPEAVAAVEAFDSAREDLSEEFRQGWQNQTTPQARLSLVLEWNKVIEDRLWPNGLARGQDYDQFQQLQHLAIGYLKHLRGTLKKGFKYLLKLVADWFAAYPDSKFLLIVDQAEELVTQTQNETERQQFLAYLDEALRAFPNRLRCVMTLRLDLEDLVRQQMPQRLEALWSRAQFVVSPMSHGELQEAIEGPAAEKVLYFEEGLVEAIIQDVMLMPGALALLSFTLSELYQKCFERFQRGEPDRQLTKADYQALGGVIGALRQRANEEYRAFDRLEQQTLKKIMLRMVAAEGGELARRRVPRTELIYADEEENQHVTKILKQLVDQRLLVTGKSAEGEYVEPAHDALVRSWEKISEWLNETTRVIPQPTRWKRLQDMFGGFGRQGDKRDAAVEVQQKFNLPLQREVNEAAERWLPFKGAKEGWDLLWTRDPRLDQLKQVHEQGRREDNWLNQREGDFVESSLQRKETLARRFRQVTATGVLGVITAAGVIAILGIRATVQARAAQRQTVRTLNQAASTHLASNNYFDALLEATRAGSLLQQHDYLSNDSALVDQTWYSLYPAKKSVNPFNHRVNLTYRLEGSSQFTFGPYGQYLASGGEDGQVKLWNLKGVLIPLHDSQHENGEVRQLQFSVDGQYLASGGEVGEVKLWQIDDPENPIPLQNSRYQNGGVEQLQFSADSQYLASGGEVGEVKLWQIDDPENPIPLQNSRYQNGGVEQLQFSADSQYLASIGSYGQVKLWRINDSENFILLHESQHESGRVTHLQFSADGQYLALGDQFGLVKLWHVDDPKNPIPLQDSQHESGGNVRHLQFSMDGQYLASGTWGDDQVKLWRIDDPENPILLHDGRHEKGAVYQLNFSLDSQYLASGGIDGQVKLWRIDDPKNPILLQDSKHEKGRVTQLQFSADGQFIASGGDDGQVKLWRIDDPENLILLQDSKHENSVVRELRFSLDSQYLASGGDDGQVKLWRIDAPENPIPLQDSWYQNGGVEQLKFSADGQYFASRGRVGQVKLWRINGTENSLPIQDSQHGNSIVEQLQLSADGQYLALGSDGQVKLWQIDDLENLISLHNSRYGNSNVFQLLFSANGQYLASGGTDGQVKLWRISDPENLIPLHDSRHENAIVYQLQLSADGQYLASGGTDSQVKLWRTNDPENLILLPDNQYENGWVTQLQLSADGQYLASMGG
ncbi:caspase family protein, partial [Sphaerothrix gracilis]|uniref:nSTAND1 domain-containing NTPase n=1 Tax=Sphaerothrix gracilis TaxID=3151835 RepID=UPI0031FCF57B